MMKKLLLALLFTGVTFMGCQENTSDLTEQQSKIDMSDFYLYTDYELAKGPVNAKSSKECYSMKVLNRQLNENKELPNKFKGKNFVFDERLAERIGNEVISQCHQCGTASDTHVNCKNQMSNW